MTGITRTPRAFTLYGSEMMSVPNVLAWIRAELDDQLALELGTEESDAATAGPQMRKVESRDPATPS